MNSEELQRIDIVEVVGETVTLRKSGRHWVGTCPFHGGRVQDFNVCKETGRFYCFGCHSKGNVVDFVTMRDGIDAESAMQILSRRLGVQP